MNIGHIVQVNLDHILPPRNLMNDMVEEGPKTKGLTHCTDKLYRITTPVTVSPEALLRFFRHNECIHSVERDLTLAYKIRRVENFGTWRSFTGASLL